MASFEHQIFGPDKDKSDFPNDGETIIDNESSAEEDGFVQWDKTVVVERRLKDDPFYEEKIIDDSGKIEKYYRGRPIIHRDSPIQGGVYVGQGVREAIVVDEKYGQLPAVYDQLLKRRADKVLNGETPNFKSGALKEVWQLVQEVMPFSKEVVSQIAKNLELKGDEKVKLDHYITEHGGVCRHQALLAAWLLEKAITDGRLHGQVSIDRNYVVGFGGHAWVRYTTARGEVFIIDPAQKYFGSLDSVSEKFRWFYKRPEDLKQK